MAWGYITRNGEKVRVKIYDQIRTYMYDCPAVNPNTDNCLKREELSVFPKECPTSRCDELRTCIQSNAHSASYCKENYPCEKVYGDSDLTPVYVNGSITALRAKCDLDGSIIENDNIREHTYTKTDCVAYDETEETNSTTKKCISTKGKTTHTVDTTITEADIYADDPECVRTNNIEDARPYVDAVFNYTNRGFFTTVIQKAYISGESEDTEHVPDVDNALPYQIENLTSSPYSSISETEIDNSGIVTSAECDAYFGSDAWYETRLENLFTDLSVKPIGVIQANSSSSPYPVVTVLKSYNCGATASKLGYEDVTADIDYEDYPFADIGINSNDELRGSGVAVISESTCVLNSPRLSGDDIIKEISIDLTAESVYMSTKSDSVDSEQCDKYAACLGLQRANYAPVFSAKTSGTITSSKTVSSCDLTTFDDEGEVELDPSSAEYFDFVETEGSLATTLDGTKDMIVLQEYAPGRFGYMSNYRFQLPKNNIIKLNNKEIFPLIPNAPINQELEYDFDIYALKQSAKNKAPSSFDAYYETLSFGALNPGGNADASNNFGAAAGGGAAAGIGALALTGPLASTGVGIVVGVVIALLAGTKRYGMIRSHWSIQNTLDYDVDYVENPYGYDFREYNSTSREFTYERTKFQTSMLKKGKYESILSDYLGLKKTSLYFAGYSHDQIDSTLIRSCETNGCVNYPSKPKWYKFKQLKSKSGTNIGTIGIEKAVNTVYMGATNTVVVFVPYQGDYEMVALDKNKNILGKRIVSESDFLETGTTAHPFAKVMFSLSDEFSLAPGMETGTTNKACLYDDFAEWGGGVSGVYYEEHTPNYHNCSKSNDAFVQDFSAHYIKFRPVDTDKYFEVKLKKPMPFANRFYFVNLGMLEERKYECYTDGAPCQP